MWQLAENGPAAQSEIQINFHFVPIMMYTAVDALNWLEIGLAGWQASSCYLDYITVSLAKEKRSRAPLV